MAKLISNVRTFLVSEDGPTAVEYAVLTGLIVVALISVIKNLSGSISTTFSTVSKRSGFIGFQQRCENHESSASTNRRPPVIKPCGRSICPFRFNIRDGNARCPYPITHEKGCVAPDRDDAGRRVSPHSRPSSIANTV